MAGPARAGMGAVPSAARAGRVGGGASAPDPLHDPLGKKMRRAVLAGPGGPSPDAGVDILLVPVHPQTARTWIPAGLTRLTRVIKRK
jgi:hypothetical protein